MSYRCINCGKPAEAPHCRECFDEEIRKRLPNVKEGWKLVRQPDGSFKWVEIWMGIKIKDAEKK